MIPIEEAFQHIVRTVKPLGVEEISLDQVVGRILAKDVCADIDSPPFAKSMMDGFAVRSEDINGGRQHLEIIGTVVAGESSDETVQSGQAIQIMTGAPIPRGADAVVMVELTTETPSPRDHRGSSDRWVSISLDQITAHKHISAQGSNFSAGQVLFPKGHQIRPVDIGLLAEAGQGTVSVSRQPRVGVLPTGDELIDCSQVPTGSQIRNSNGPLLRAWLRSFWGQSECGFGFDVVDLGIGADDHAALRAKIETGLEQDLLLLTGGVSAGTRDLVPEILAELGVEQVFHKVRVKPGKPIWFGQLNRDGKQTIVFGLPGNPVSSLVGVHLFVRLAIKRMLGIESTGPDTRLKCKLTQAHQTRGDRPTYWPGKLVATDQVQRQAEPLIWKGSSDLFSLGQAEGLIFFEADSKDHLAGEQVDFYPF